jgi:hypothetical protein
MRVLVACEFSGVVRDAFRARGHDAWSCDLQPTEREGPHIQDDVLKHLADGWDLMIAHPPCTHLCVSGARWFIAKRHLIEESLDFVRALMAAPIPRYCIENPVSIISSAIRPPDQIVQPWQFGDPSVKTTCLWMRRLPGIFPTKVVEPEYVQSGTGRTWSKWWWESSLISRKDGARSRFRSRTFQGIADAMAEQWGIFDA